MKRLCISVNRSFWDDHIVVFLVIRRLILFMNCFPDRLSCSTQICFNSLQITHFLSKKQEKIVISDKKKLINMCIYSWGMIVTLLFYPIAPSAYFHSFIWSLFNSTFWLEIWAWKSRRTFLRSSFTIPVLILLDSSVSNKYDGNDGEGNDGDEKGDDGNDDGDKKITLARLVWFNGDNKRIIKRKRERVGSSAETMWVEEPNSAMAFPSFLLLWRRKTEGGRRRKNTVFGMGSDKYTCNMFGTYLCSMVMN